MTNLMEDAATDILPAEAAPSSPPDPSPSTAASDTIAPLICNHILIRKATRQLGLLFDGVMAATDLKATQCGLLMQIDAMRAPTMKDLARTLVMDLSALGHTLKPLIRDGYVVLKPDRTDRRIKRVELTPVGLAKMAEIERLCREATRRFEIALGMEPTKVLRSTLSIVASEAFGHAFRDADLPSEP